MAAYCFFDITETSDRSKMDAYRRDVGATVAQFGGRYLAVGGPFEVIEGGFRPVFPVIIEFPSLDQAKRWYDSSEYSALKDLRLSATKGHAVFTAGL